MEKIKARMEKLSLVLEKIFECNDERRKQEILDMREQMRESCYRFSLLTMGNMGSGKSSLMSHLLSTDFGKLPTTLNDFTRTNSHSRDIDKFLVLKYIEKNYVSTEFIISVLHEEVPVFVSSSVATSIKYSYGIRYTSSSMLSLSKPKAEFGAVLPNNMNILKLHKSDGRKVFLCSTIKREDILSAFLSNLLRVCDIMKVRKYPRDRWKSINYASTYYKRTCFSDKLIA